MGDCCQLDQPCPAELGATFPTAVLSSKLPPRRSARVLRLAIPLRRWRDAIPVPLSTTVIARSVTSVVISTSTAVAWAYLAAVAERLPDDGLDIVDQIRLNRRCQAGPSKPTRGAKPNTAGTSSTTARTELRRDDVLGHIVELEDRHPDLLDRLVEILDASCQNRTFDLWIRHHGGRGLDGEPGREQTLNDVVVQIPGDPFPILQHECRRSWIGAAVGQLEGQRRLVGKGLRHVQVDAR